MKKWAPACLMALLIVCASSAPGRAGDLKKVFLADSPWPPYTKGEMGQAPTGGIGIDIIRHLFGRLDMDVDIELHPWKRVLKMVETGQADGSALLMHAPDRERYLVYTEPVFQAREVLFFRSDRIGDFQWNTFDDLKGYRIGLVAGYTYGPHFLQAVKEKNLTVEQAVSDRVNFRKLYAGRIDLFLEDELVAASMMGKNPAWKNAFKMASKPVSAYDLYLGFSKKSPAASMLKDVNRVIREMKEDGTIDRMLGRVQ